MEWTLARETAEGAKTLVWGATAGHDDPVKLDSLKGAYTSDCKIEEPSDFIFTNEGQEFEKRIWVGAFVSQGGMPLTKTQSETLDILARVDPRVRDIASEYLS
jgi:retinol dehydrogenase-12